MKHVRDQNWFAVGLDFLIVVVGVFDWHTHGSRNRPAGLMVAAIER